MKKIQKKWILAVFLFLATAAAVWMMKDSGTGRPGGASSSSSPMAEFSGADLKEEENGQLVWSLKVDHVKVDPQTQISYLTGVQGFFQKGDSRLKLQAQQGTVDQKKKQIHLEGSIEGKSSDGITLNAKNLDYDGNTDILSAQGGFTAEQDGRVLTADSFTADRVLQEIKAMGSPRLSERNDAT